MFTAPASHAHVGRNGEGLTFASVQRFRGDPHPWYGSVAAAVGPVADSRVSREWIQLLTGKPLSEVLRVISERVAADRVPDPTVVALAGLLKDKMSRAQRAVLYSVTGLLSVVPDEWCADVERQLRQFEKVDADVMDSILQQLLPTRGPCDDECSVCLEPLGSRHDSVVVLGCKHLFHSACMQSVRACPTCSLPLKNVQSLGDLHRKQAPEVVLCVFDAEELHKDVKQGADVYIRGVDKARVARRRKFAALLTLGDARGWVSARAINMNMADGSVLVPPPARAAHVDPAVEAAKTWVANAFKSAAANKQGYGFGYKEHRFMLQAGQDKAMFVLQCTHCDVMEVLTLEAHKYLMDIATEAMARKLKEDFPKHADDDKEEDTAIVPHFQQFVSEGGCALCYDTTSVLACPFCRLRVCCHCVVEFKSLFCCVVCGLDA